MKIVIVIAFSLFMGMLITASYHYEMPIGKRFGENIAKIRTHDLRASNSLSLSVFERRHQRLIEHAAFLASMIPEPCEQAMETWTRELKLITRLSQDALKRTWYEAKTFCRLMPAYYPANIG